MFSLLKQYVASFPTWNLFFADAQHLAETTAANLFFIAVFCGFFAFAYNTMPQFWTESENILCMFLFSNNKGVTR